MAGPRNNPVFNGKEGGGGGADLKKHAFYTALTSKNEVKVVFLKGSLYNLTNTSYTKLLLHP